MSRQGTHTMTDKKYKMPYLYVLDENFDKEGVIDAYVNFYYAIRYNDFGEATLNLSVTNQAFPLLKLEKVIYMDEYNHWIISDIEVKNDMAEIKLESFTKQMLYRATIPNKGESHIHCSKMPVEDVINKLIDRCCINPEDINRKVPFMSTTREFTTNIIVDDYKARYRQLFEEVVNITRLYELGFRVKMDLLHKNFEFQLYKGHDRGNEIKFSERFDNIIDVEYKNSLDENRNVCYVLGQGKMQERTVVQVNANENPPTGYKRREIVRDARDVQDHKTEEGQEPPKEDVNVLIMRGKESLNEHKIVERVDCEIVPDSTYKWGVDYNIGDIVNVHSVRYNYSYQDRITEVNTEWTLEKGMSMGLIIGKENEEITLTGNEVFE